MKKNILTFLLITVSMCAFGQKGSWWAGGAFSYLRTTEDENGLSYKNDAVTVIPYVEYFFQDTWSVYGGANFGYAKSRYTDIDSNPATRTVRHNDLGPYFGIGKYFPMTKHITFFLSLHAEGAWGTLKGNDYSYSTSRYAIGIYPGFQILLNDKVSLYMEFSELSYEATSSKNKNNSNDKTTGSRFTTDFFNNGVNLGLQFRIK